jgi:hypothetical protein
MRLKGLASRFTLENPIIVGLLIARIFTKAVDGFYQVVGRWKILKDAMGCSISEFPQLLGVSAVITSGNIAAAFNVKIVQE